MARRLPELSHVRHRHLLIVAGEARGTSRATIGSGSIGTSGIAGRRRFIRLRGRTILYVITLRPLWFAASTRDERISTILHELYHVSTRFDGTLHSGRRHGRLPRAAYDRKIRAMLERYLAMAPEEILAPFESEGLVRVRMWLRPPRAAATRRQASLDMDEHLLQGYMPMSGDGPTDLSEGRERGLVGPRGFDDQSEHGTRELAIEPDEEMD